MRKCCTFNKIPAKPLEGSLTIDEESISLPIGNSQIPLGVSAYGSW